MWRRSLPRLATAASGQQRHVGARALSLPHSGAGGKHRQHLWKAARCLGTVEARTAGASPGVSSAVAANAAGWAVPDAHAALPGNLRECVDALRLFEGKENLTPEEVQPLAQRSIELARGAAMSELADLADIFRVLRVRIPLREMMPAVSERLEDPHIRSDPASLGCVLRIMSSTGKGSLFYNELFEFCHQQLGAMDASNIAIYLYEAGRHGLRCRHFIDAAVSRATALVPQMSLDEVMMVTQGLIRFTRDWKQFYMVARPRILKEVGSLSVAQLLLALRTARDLRHIPDFAAFHAACCAELMFRVEKLSVNEAACCLMHLSFSPKFRAQAHGLVSSIVQKWNRTEDLSSIRVVEVVDALETVASWGMKPLPLTDRLCDILVERAVELKYSGNVSLWILATQALARMDHLGASWPLVALELARDKPFVERVSFFQQGMLIEALAKLRLFDETVYDNVAESLLADFDLFREAKDLAPILQAYTTAGHYHQQLFDGAYDRVLEWIEADELDLTKRPTQGGFIQIALCFAQAGFHRRYESFAAILDYAFFTKFSELAPLHLRRLAQLADLVLEEEPAQAQNCQYPSHIEGVRTAPAVRRLISSDPPSDAQLVKSIQSSLAELAWPSETFAAVGDTAPCLVDVSLEAKFGKKVGLLIANQYDLLQVGLPREQQPLRPTGMLALVQRLLALRGWQTAIISEADWRPLKSTDEKRRFLEGIVQSMS